MSAQQCTNHIHAAVCTSTYITPTQLRTAQQPTKACTRTVEMRLAPAVVTAIPNSVRAAISSPTCFLSSLSPNNLNKSRVLALVRSKHVVGGISSAERPAVKRPEDVEESACSGDVLSLPPDSSPADRILIGDQSGAFIPRHASNKPVVPDTSVSPCVTLQFRDWSAMRPQVRPVARRIEAAETTRVEGEERARCWWCWPRVMR